MGWTADFIARISAPRIAPIYVIEAIPAPLDQRPLGGNMLLASNRTVADAKDVLVPEGSTITYGALQVREWSYTFAEWSIGLLDQNRTEYDIRNDTTRGQVVALKIGFTGWKTAQFQTVALGVVQTVEMRGGRWSIRCRSILSALVTRNATATAKQALFHVLDETTLAADYAASAATVSLTDGFAALERESPGTNLYAVRITPDSGDPFIVTASGKTSGPPDGLTGVSPTSICGPAVADAASGNRVEILAYVQDHPLEVARKILTSTGVADANGDYDTLPESWGLGFPQELVDDGDCQQAVTHHSPNGIASPVWDVYAAAEQEDALGFLQSVLAPMGCFLCERQGAVTIRGAAMHSTQPGTMVSWDIYDDDLVSIDSYSAYDPSTPVEYNRFRLEGPDGGDTDLDEQVDSRPALGTHLVPLPFIESDRTAWREHIRAAIGTYSTRVGEPVTITLRGWRLAQAAPGDHIQIHTSPRYLTSRRIGLGADISTGAPILVTSVEPDWFGSTTRITGVHVTAEPAE